MRRSTAVVECPKSMVGRVIGKNGETIKALQSYSGALIQIDQTLEPTKVTISGTPHSLSLAVSIVSDIVKGTFKGFALLRQVTQSGSGGGAAVVGAGGAARAPLPAFTPVGPGQSRPVYAPGYGLIPPSQLYGGEDRATAAIAAYGGSHAAQLQQQQQLQQQFNYGGATPSQMLMGLQRGGGGSMNNLNGHMQQLTMQQVYGMAQLHGLAYYPPQDYTGGLQDPQMAYPDQNLYHQMLAAAAAAAAPMQQQHQQQQDYSALNNMASGGRFNNMMQQQQNGGGGRGRGNGGGGGGGGNAGGGRGAVPDWLPSGKEGNNMHVGVSDLLGSGDGDDGEPGPALMANGAGGGNLVMDQEGKMYFINPLQES